MQKSAFRSLLSSLAARHSKSPISAGANGVSLSHSALSQYPSARSFAVYPTSQCTASSLKYDSCLILRSSPRHGPTSSGTPQSISCATTLGLSLTCAEHACGRPRTWTRVARRSALNRRNGSLCESSFRDVALVRFTNSRSQLLAYDHGSNARGLFHRSWLGATITEWPRRPSTLRSFEIFRSAHGRQDPNTSGHKAR